MSDLPTETTETTDPLERAYEHALAVHDAARDRVVDLLLARIGRLTAEHYPDAVELSVLGLYDSEELKLYADRVIHADGGVIDGYDPEDGTALSEKWDAFTDYIDTTMLDVLAGFTGGDYSGRHSIPVPGDSVSLVSATETLAEALGVAVIITTSTGSDGAVLVILDTTFEPDGSDGGPGLRVMVNDGVAFEGVPFIPEAGE